MFWGYLFLAIGIGWILQYYGVIPKDLEFFWPVMFIALGLSILLGRRKSNWTCCNWIDGSKDKGKK